MKKMVNGVYLDMTASEIAQQQADEKIWNDGAFDRALHNLRIERNNLLAETDYLALSDRTLTTDMQRYRTQLRDITNGLTTVEEVEAVVFPTKPTE